MEETTDMMKNANESRESDMLKICEFVKSIFGGEPLNGDDIEDVTYALQVFNGDIEGFSLVK